MSYNFTTVPLMDQQSNGQLELTLGQLRKATKFLIVVRAFNRYGEGPLSSPATAVTFEDGWLILILLGPFIVRPHLVYYNGLPFSSVCWTAIAEVFDVVVAEHRSDVASAAGFGAQRNHSELSTPLRDDGPGGDGQRVRRTASQNGGRNLRHPGRIVGPFGLSHPSRGRHPHRSRPIFRLSHLFNGRIW